MGNRQHSHTGEIVFAIPFAFTNPASVTFVFLT